MPLTKKGIFSSIQRLQKYKDQYNIFKMHQAWMYGNSLRNFHSKYFSHIPNLFLFVSGHMIKAQNLTVFLY